MKQEDMERYIIGSVLSGKIDAELMLREVATGEAFTTPEHQSLYALIKECYQEHGEVDIAKIHLLSNGRFGVDLLLEYGEVFSHEGSAQYLLRLSELGRLRRLKADLASIDMNGGTPIDDVLTQIDRAGNIAVDLAPTNNEVESIGEVGSQTTEDAANAADLSRQRFVSTRISELDKRIGGLFRGELTIVAGPPSMGKTMFASDVCLFNHTLGKRVSLYVSLDQPKDSIVFRVLTSLRKVTKQGLLSGKLSDITIGDAKAALAELTSFYMIDKPSLTVPQIHNHCRRLKRKRGLDIVVVDYVQQLRWHGKPERRDLELGYMIEELKAIAKELDVVMIAVSQLSREYLRSIRVSPGKNRWGMPHMSMLRDSGVLEAAANLILFPWVPLEILKKHPDFGEQSDAYKEIMRKNPTMREGYLYDVTKECYIVIGKNKDGETGTVPCKRDLERMRFYSEARDEQ